MVALDVGLTEILGRHKAYPYKAPMKRFIAFFLGLCLLVCCCGTAAVLGYGIWRYGGWSGLRQRVRAELQTAQPRPTSAPTLVPAATLDTAAFMQGLATPIPIPPTNTPLPDSFTQVAAETPTLRPSPMPLPERVWLEGYGHVWQTWNNCGPATMVTYLSYWGVAVSQGEVAAVIKPHPDDKNVALAELLAYAQERGMNGRLLFNGRADVLRNLLANGYPVLVETWLEEHPNDGLGHYRLLVGYDEGAQVWLVADSYVGTGATQPYTFIQVPYEQFAAQWAVFNRPYLVLYPPAEAEAVQEMIGEVWMEEMMWERALFDLQAEAEARPSDPFVWFNLGSVLVERGQYEQAAVAFDQARVLGLPWRMLWYQFGVFEAYVAVGRAAEAVALAQATLDSGGTAAEVYEWQARAWLALGDEAAARESFGLAAEFRGEE